MQRVTIAIDDDLLGALDDFIKRHRYATRSEAVRDLVRSSLGRKAADMPAGKSCVATVSYVFDPYRGELAQRVSAHHHANHGLNEALLHVHLDHHSCLEIAVLRGPMDAVRRHAEELIAERGVRYGQISVVPAEITVETHKHAGLSHPHLHSRPVA